MTEQNNAPQKEPLYQTKTRCEMTQIVIPQQRKCDSGTVFKGQIMAWIDICAAVSAVGCTAGSHMASMDSLPVQRHH